MSEEAKRTRHSEQLAVPTPARTSTPSHPIRTSGIIASAGWLAARGLFCSPDRPWRVDMVMTVADRLDCKLAVHINHVDWGFELVHGSRASTIRVGHMPTIVGRDDHNLLAMTPQLRGFSAFVRELENRYHVHFQRAQAQITSSIAGAEPNVRAWLVSL